jgi:hypothetical protein
MAFQMEPCACQTLLPEVATPTAMPVREMASGLARAAVEVEERTKIAAGRRWLLERAVWRA